jgi:hypothetical protein
MSINREYEVGVARHGQEAETVTFAALDIDNCQANLGSTNISSYTIDQSRIFNLEAKDIGGKDVVPEGYQSARDDPHQQGLNHQSESVMIVDSEIVVHVEV